MLFTKRLFLFHMKKLLSILVVLSFFACGDDDGVTTSSTNSTQNEDYSGVYIGTRTDKGTVFSFPIDETTADTMYIFKDGESHYLSDTSVFVKSEASGKFNRNKEISLDTTISEDGSVIKTLYKASVSRTTLSTDIAVDAGLLMNYTSKGTYEKQ